MTTIVAAVFAVGCATSAGPEPLAYWTVAAPATHAVGCATAEVWVSKSGKTGLGLTVALATAEPVCQVELRSATLTVAGRAVPASPPPAALVLTPGGAQYRYLPFLFDNDGAWRAGVRTAEVMLHLRAADAPAPPLRLPLEQHLLRPHRAEVMLSPRPDVGCARLDAHVIAFKPDRLALRLTVESQRPDCRARLVGPSSLWRKVATNLGHDLEQAPPGDTWHALPATWVVVARRPPTPGRWWLALDIATEPGKVSTVEISIKEDDGPWFMPP